MRDALSLLDQAISFSQDIVKVEDALTVTGAVSQGYLNTLARAILDRDVSKALSALEELLFQGKDPARFAEDFILYYRDMLLYQTAPNLEESMERVMLDDEFKGLAQETEASQIYQYIDVLNQAGQEMKFTNHARIYLEVSIVKLCQLEAPRSVSSPEVGEMMKKIQSLENEIQQLKANGVKAQAEPAAQPDKKPVRAKKGFRAPVGQIQEVLKNATKEDLNLIKSRWGDMMESLNQRQMRSQAALLNDAEPVAATTGSFVLKFKYDIHCQMAMENQAFISGMSQILQELTGSSYSPIGIPEDQWLPLREDFIRNSQNESPDGETGEAKEEDSLLSEAEKIAGDLVEIKD